MSAKTSRFLCAVLGPVGGKALGMLAKSDPGLAGYLVPRTALAWLGRVGDTLDLPGVPEGGIVLSKKQDGFHGAITIGDAQFDLAGADANTVAAAVSIAVGVTPALAKGLRERHLAQLGHTIDLLAKAQAKKPEVEGTGSAAAAIAPIAPAAPTPTAPDTSKRRRVNIPLRPAQPAGAPKPRTAPLALSERDAGRKCSACGASQFQNGKFRGCYCIRSMVKSIDASRGQDGRWTIDLGRLQPDEAALAGELLKGTPDAG